MKIPRKIKLLLIIIIVPFLVGALYALHITQQSNFNKITEGEAYRSAQMDGDLLKHYINTYQIKSVLNLRGRNSAQQWYIDELKISSEQNVRHYDVALSAHREPTQEETRLLMELIKYAPRPVLIHCQAGADRTGLVAAMWKVIVNKEPKEEAAKQLSIWYGHMPVGPATAMDNFFEKWVPELTIVNSRQI
jgi:undecaprenyl-diphosphatase